MSRIARLCILAASALALVSVGSAATASGASEPREATASSHAARVTTHVGDLATESRQASCADPLVPVTEVDRSPRGQLRAASCKARSGKMLDGLRDAQAVLEGGLVHEDADATAAASERVAELVSRLPHVDFVVPRGVTKLKVTFDGRSVSKERLARRSAVDPGRHRIVADGLVRGVAKHFEADVEITEQQLATIRLDLAARATR